MNDPEQSIRTSARGRRAAAVRDGRAKAGDATTQVIAKHPSEPWEVRGHGGRGGWCRVTDGQGQDIAAGLRREDADLIAAAPQLLAAARALLACAPANVLEDREALEAVMIGNQAVSDALGHRRCDFCNGTGFKRLLYSHTWAPCDRCERG